MKNAKTFEDVRIVAAAVGAWGREGLAADKLPKLGFELLPRSLLFNLSTDKARDLADLWVSGTRLGWFLVAPFDFGLGNPQATAIKQIIAKGIVDEQADDGGWRMPEEKNASDIESTYRVVQALKLLGEKPEPLRLTKLREFISSLRKNDDGYTTKLGESSSMAGVFYAVMISKWLDEMKEEK